MAESGNSVPDNVCRHCFEPVNRWTVHGRVTWAHGGDAANYDHDPDPIPRAEVTTVRYLCDFCGDSGTVEWAYPTRGEVNHTLAVPTVTDDTVIRAVGRRLFDPARGRKTSEFEQVSPEEGAPVPLVENHFSDRWTACGDCARVVELDDINRLVTHLRRKNPRIASRSRRFMADHFREFFAQRLPREPITKPEPPTEDSEQ